MLPQLLSINFSLKYFICVISCKRADNLVLPRLPCWLWFCCSKPTHVFPPSSPWTRCQPQPSHVCLWSRSSWQHPSISVCHKRPRIKHGTVACAGDPCTHFDTYSFFLMTLVLVNIFIQQIWNFLFYVCGIQALIIPELDLNLQIFQHNNRFFIEF